MVLTDILTHSAQRYASKPALTMRMGYRTITLTYKQVEELACKVALFLEAQGLGKGDTVLLCAPNSPYWVCVWWGCLLRGCWVVPLAVASTQSTIEKIARQTQAKVFFTSIHVRFTVPSATTFIVEYLPDLVASFSVDAYKPIKITQSDVAEIMFTSGTTGDPKGVVLTHGNIVSNVEVLEHVLRISGGKERILSILPLSHMLEQTTGMILPCLLGVHIIYAHSHGAIRELLNAYRITKMITVPEFLKLMAQRIQSNVREEKREKVFTMLMNFAHKIGIKWAQRLLLRPVITSLGGKLDTFASGGAALDPDLEQWWDTCGLYVLQGYGLTETSPVVTINDYDQRKVGSVGKPLSNVQIRLTKDGEIEVNGPNVFRGYFNDEARTKECFTSDGWFKTGDMGHVDADGFLFLKGRRKYMIKGPGAENIFPEDIETVLNTISGVRDSCVVGVEKKSGMVEIHAVLLLADQSLKAADIVHQANEHLASYQRVTGWSVWPEEDFPRSVTRKVKKEMVITWIKERQENHNGNGVNAVSPLIHLLAEISGVSAHAIHATTSLMYDLKFDSLMRVELVTRIEDMKGVLIDERLITGSTTVADLENIIATAKPLTKMPAVKRWPRWLLARMIRGLWQMLQWPLVRIFFTVKIEGEENLKNAQLPIILMPNHVSLIDSFFVVAALPRMLRKKLSFAAAYDVLYEEYWYLRWLGELFFNTFPFPRKEHEHVATGLLNMGTMLDDGYSVVVFPEGAISKDGKLQPLKRGAGLIAIEMGCAVIPVKMKGIEQAIPYNCIFPRKRGKLTIVFGKPIIFTKSMTYDQTTSMIEAALRDL
jgi:long-chain acyl-CoA synthetase